MGWHRSARLLLVLSVLGLVLSASLLPTFFGSTGATGPTETSHPESGSTSSTGTAIQAAGALQPEPGSRMQIYDPERPPDRPPKPVLLLDYGVSHASDTRQSGVLVYYTWVLYGKLDTYEAEPPISWPEPLKVKNTYEAVVDLGTDVMPRSVEVYVYEKVGPNGVPQGEPVKVLTCKSGQLEAGRLGSSESCTVPHDEEPKGNQQLVLPIRSWENERFFAVWAAWPVPVDKDAKSPGPVLEYAASWIFSLEVVP